MIGLREPDLPASLVLHDAHLDLVALLVADLLRGEARHAVEIGLQRVGVAVECAGIDDRHAHPDSEVTDLVADGVRGQRGRLGHVRGEASLLVGFGVLVDKGASLGPVDPESIAVADEDTAFCLRGRFPFHAEVVRLLEPRTIGATVCKVAFAFDLVTADIRERIGLPQGIDHLPVEIVSLVVALGELGRDAVNGLLHGLLEHGYYRPFLFACGLFVGGRLLFGGGCLVANGSRGRLIGGFFFGGRRRSNESCAGNQDRVQQDLKQALAPSAGRGSMFQRSVSPARVLGGWTWRVSTPRASSALKHSPTRSIAPPVGRSGVGMGSDPEGSRHCRLLQQAFTDNEREYKGQEPVRQIAVGSVTGASVSLSRSLRGTQRRRGCPQMPFGCSVRRRVHRTVISTDGSMRMPVRGNRRVRHNV